MGRSWFQQVLFRCRIRTLQGLLWPELSFSLVLTLATLQQFPGCGNPLCFSCAKPAIISISGCSVKRAPGGTTARAEHFRAIPCLALGHLSTPVTPLVNVALHRGRALAMTSSKVQVNEKKHFF